MRLDWTPELVSIFKQPKPQWGYDCVTDRGGWRSLALVRTTIARYVMMAVLLRHSMFSAMGITIRDDTPDAWYIALANDVQFNGVGSIRRHANATPSNPSFCTGTLVHPEWVLTAGHCAVDSAAWHNEFRLGPTIDNPILTRTIVTQHALQGAELKLLKLSQPIISSNLMRVRRSSALEQTVAATILGYGQSGTGLTPQGGELPPGTKRAMTQAVDGPFSAGMTVDFDNPAGTTNQFGSNVPLPLEGGTLAGDSGGPWIQQIPASTGFKYVTGITVGGSGNYGSGTLAHRTIPVIDEIDAAYDRTLFWNGNHNQNWSTSASWYGGIAPAFSNAAVIDLGTVNVTAANHGTRYTFVTGNGTLNLQSSFTSSSLVIRESGKLTLGIQNNNLSYTQSSVFGNLLQEGGRLEFDIRNSTSGNYDSLFVSESVTLSGTIAITTPSVGGIQYMGPTIRGRMESIMVLGAAALTSSSSAITYNGASVPANLQLYAGANQSGLDGVFRNIFVNSTSVHVVHYLALPGDANGDCVVDGSDYGILNANRFQHGTNWTTGDFNGDGSTDGSDVGIYYSNQFTRCSAVEFVPEPCLAVVPLAIGVAVVVRSANQRFYVSKAHPPFDSEA